MSRKNKNARSGKLHYRKLPGLTLAKPKVVHTFAEAEKLASEMPLSDEPDKVEAVSDAEEVVLVPDEEESTIDTRSLVTLVAYLIGVRKEYLDQHYSDNNDLLERLGENNEAKIVRYLCEIRTALFRKFGTVDRQLKFEMKNLDRQEGFDAENIRELERMGVPILQTNYVAEKYCADICRLIGKHIDDCRQMFPDWIKWDYIRDLFIVPKFSETGPLHKEIDRYRNQYNRYPFHMYIHWKPEDSGLILKYDRKFLSVIYSQHGDHFTDYSKLRDATDTTKSNIYSFIDDAARVAIAVDCENSDPFKLFSVIRGLDENKIKKIDKISLYDDANTTVAWDILGKFLHIPVEHIEVERVVGHKSLVDIKMAVSVSKDYYENGISSFLLFSSDSDFWGLISSMPQTRFLVMYEYGKCGNAILETMGKHNIPHCAIDDFCSVPAGDLKKMVLLRELESRLPNILGQKPLDVAQEIYAVTKILGTKQEIENFCEKYIKTIKFQVGADGTLELAIRR